MSLGIRNRVRRSLYRFGLRARRRMGDFELVYAPGKGSSVFALKAFAPGELVLPVTGSPARGRGGYTIQVGPDAHVDPAPPLKFCNHSCDPNTGIRADAAGRPGFYARRLIAPGDEVTWDYAMSESDFVIDGEQAAFRCFCGSPLCRSLIEKGWGGLSQERRRDYRDWAMPYLRGRAP